MSRFVKTVSATGGTADGGSTLPSCASFCCLVAPVYKTTCDTATYKHANSWVVLDSCTVQAGEELAGVTFDYPFTCFCEVYLDLDFNLGTCFVRYQAAQSICIHLGSTLCPCQANAATYHWKGRYCLCCYAVTCSFLQLEGPSFMTPAKSSYHFYKADWMCGYPCTTTCCTAAVAYKPKYCYMQFQPNSPTSYHDINWYGTNVDTTNLAWVPTSEDRAWNKIHILVAQCCGCYAGPDTRYTLLAKLPEA